MANSTTIGRVAVSVDDILSLRKALEFELELEFDGIRVSSHRSGVTRLDYKKGTSPLTHEAQLENAFLLQVSTAGSLCRPSVLSMGLCHRG